MGNLKISDLTAYTTPVSADVLPIVDTSNATTKKVTMASLFNILSSLFTIKDSSDTTKKVAFNVSGVTTATTRTVTIPDANTTMVGTDTSQTLTNKTIGTGTKINTSGADATGSMYYRDASGNLTAISGTTSEIVSLDVSGIPEFIPNPSAADATYSTKGVRVLDADVVYYGVDSGSTDAYAITLSPAPTAYVAGQRFSFKANTVNTGTATLNVNGLGAKTIVKGVNTTLADGDIATGEIHTVIYDGTNFVLQSPVATVASGTAGNKMLFQSSTTLTSDTSTTSETTLLTKTIPGGTLGTGNVLRVNLKGNYNDQGSTAVLTLKFKYGSTTLTTSTITGINDGSTNHFFDASFDIYATGSVSSQKGLLQFFAFRERTTLGTANPVYLRLAGSGTATENSANDLSFTITTQYNTTGGATIEIYEYTIERLAQ
ncbi:MAG: hypothetical protein ACR2IQ_02620 [Minisyncoccia bacterium]